MTYSSLFLRSASGSKPSPTILKESFPSFNSASKTSQFAELTAIKIACPRHPNHQSQISFHEFHVRYDQSACARGLVNLLSQSYLSYCDDDRARVHVPSYPSYFIFLIVSF